MHSPAVAGFWSYARDDDRHENGRILRLAENLNAEFTLLTGTPLTLFVDRVDLAWGMEWRRRIDEALASTTVFMPIITPRYFQSRECRQELLTFVGHARSLDVGELLLPIVYVATPALDPASGDEAAALVAATHCESWTELRLVDENASAYRRAVNRLARRLAEISDAVATRPPADSIAPPAAELRDDHLANRLETAFGRCMHDLDALRAPLREVRHANTRFVTALRQIDAEGADADVRTAVQRYAAEIDDPSRRIAPIGGSYATHLVDVDPLMLRLIRAAAAAKTDADRRDAADLFAVVRQWADISHKSAATIGPLGDLLDYLLDHAQPARTQLQRIGAGLRGVADGEAILDEWARRVELVGGDPP